MVLKDGNIPMKILQDKIKNWKDLQGKKDSCLKNKWGKQTGSIIPFISSNNEEDKKDYFKTKFNW